MYTYVCRVLQWRMCSERMYECIRTYAGCCSGVCVRSVCMKVHVRMQGVAVAYVFGASTALVASGAYV
jgi:hypothetical protein